MKAKLSELWRSSFQIRTAILWLGLTLIARVVGGLIEGKPMDTFVLPIYLASLIPTFIVVIFLDGFPSVDLSVFDTELGVVIGIAINTLPWAIILALILDPEKGFRNLGLVLLAAASILLVSAAFCVENFSLGV